MGDEAQATPTTPAVTKKSSRLLPILFTLWAFWMGWSGWKSFIPKPEVNATEQPELRAISARLTVLRDRLLAIASRPVNNVDDYISNTLETWPIVDEGKGLIRLQMAEIARFKQVHATNTMDMRVADYMMRLTEKDEELLYLLADEIECARQLKSLPTSQRMAFYNANVPQIAKKEAERLKDFVAIAKDAKTNGIPVPDYVEKMIKDMESQSGQ